MIRWGVLGVAKIAVEKVIPAMQHCEHGQVTAIASRDASRAQAAAERLSLAKSYASYDELLADPDIDAIYNPLPNHLHVPWSIKALEAGKHVLCEKPLALTAAEAQTLVDAAAQHPQLKVMEAFMYRHHPQWVAARKLVQDGAVGELRTIGAFFSYFNRDPDNVRNQADIGGGGLMDIGCYPISMSRFICGREPERVIGIVERDPDFRTDRLASAILDFGDVISTFTCSTQLMPFQRVYLMGTTGRVEVEIPWNAPFDRPCNVWLDKADGTREQVPLEAANQYMVQGELFAQAVLNNTPVPTPLSDGVRNMETIEAIVRSGESGTWEVPLRSDG